MIAKRFTMEEISPKLPKTINEAHVVAYIQEAFPETQNGLATRHPAVLVLPGGGYRATTNREADPVALKFVAEGFSAFILRYSCAPDRYPTQLLQAAATIAFLRTHAEEYHIDPDRIFTLGFSAGGHLTASTGILWKEPVIKEVLGIENELCRPTGMVPCYPVITSGEYAHRGSFDNLLGPDASQEMLDYVSLEKRIDADTVPAFLWHTFNDGAVPVENSLLVANAMRKHNVPFELHIYPDGVHGLSLCNELSSKPGQDALLNPHDATWMKLCIEWMKLF